MPRTLTAPPALGDDLAALRAHFAPMLDRIRAGAVEREIERRLPHEEIRALDEAGFEGWLIVEAEQDAAKAHPLTYAMKAREHLGEIAGI